MEGFAYLFPGQGSQRIGMGRDLADRYPEARARFDLADDVLSFKLSTLCFEGPEDALRSTVNTQPALYVTSCAALDALRSAFASEPTAVAGHSVGEYAALYAAGAISFEDGLRLVRRRAELMHLAAEARPGAMAAVLGLEADAVADVVASAQAAGVVGVANYNCPGQIVISGEAQAVAEAGALLREAGAKRVLPLPVSGGFHSALMSEAGDALRSVLERAAFVEARVPVVANVDAAYAREPVCIVRNLAAQVSGSVRWEESMRLLIADGVRRFVEIGSGDVLSGLMKRIDRTVSVVSVQDPGSLEAAVTMLSAPEGLIDEA